MILIRNIITAIINSICINDPKTLKPRYPTSQRTISIHAIVDNISLFLFYLLLIMHPFIIPFYALVIASDTNTPINIITTTVKTFIIVEPCSEFCMRFIIAYITYELTVQLIDNTITFDTINYVI